MKLIYFISLLISLGFFNSCGEKVIKNDSFKQPHEIVQKKHIKLPDNVYGTYLAARTAHMRQDYNLAADYYIKSMDLGAKNIGLINSIYLLLASEGRISEAADYALKARQDGDDANLILFILMTEDMHEGLFDEAYKNSLSIKGKPFEDTILPLFQAWIFASKNEKQKALDVLNHLKKEQALAPIYHMHRGMINDYFDDQDAALQDYEIIINDESMPLSFRALEIIGHFYIKSGMKDKIIEVAQKYSTQNSQNPMLEALIANFKKAEIPATEKYIDTAQKGFAEAMFNVGTIFRSFQNETAQLFMALVLYLNQDFDVARISLAELYEQTNRIDKAVDEYTKIKQASPIYYMAQIKIADEYMAKEQDENAFETLQNLLKLYPRDERVTFRLGELTRKMGRYTNAVSFYQETLSNQLHEKSSWVVYYALGIAYERQNKWDQAEDSFKKSLELSGRHPIVLNYLGYSWLERGLNYNEAIYMIFEAHRKNSLDGHIVDSLGWALYKMGNYQEAVKVLERASEYLPSNAVIFDHLGDAYWQAGRKNEARFQWQHALNAKEDAEDINESKIKEKLEQGMQKNTPIPFNEQLLIDRLKILNAE